MTPLQKVEFEMLKIFVDICNENQLTYYLVCGSALGAAKYSGFIPWDDDVDVALPRRDYERFCEIAQEMLPEEIFLQNYKTDPGYAQIFSKLRNSNTTYIEKSAAHCDINHGVYIDVFVLDGYPKDNNEAGRLERKKRLLELRRSCVYDLPDVSKKAKAFMAMERMLGYHKRIGKTVEELTGVLSAYPIEESELMCNHGNWQGRKEYAPKQQYGLGTWASFEGLKVRIPEDIDTYLTQKYGDWRADLPEEERAGHHYCAVCDVEHPYTDYIEKLPNGEIRIKSVK